MLKKYLLMLLVLVGFQSINGQNPPAYVEENPPAYQKYDLQNLVTVQKVKGSYFPHDVVVNNNGDDYLRTLPNELQTVIIEKAKTVKTPYMIRIAGANRTLEAMKNFDNFNAKVFYSDMLKNNKPTRFITDHNNIKNTGETRNIEKNYPNFKRHWWNGEPEKTNANS